MKWGRGQSTSSRLGKVSDRAVKTDIMTHTFLLYVFCRRLHFYCGNSLSSAFEMKIDRKKRWYFSTVSIKGCVWNFSTLPYLILTILPRRDHQFYHMNGENEEERLINLSMIVSAELIDTGIGRFTHYFMIIIQLWLIYELSGLARSGVLAERMS